LHAASTAQAAPIFAMERIFRAVPIDAITAGCYGWGRGEQGREKLLSVILSIHAGFLICKLLKCLFIIKKS